jgi:hypothetical protein
VGQNIGMAEPRYCNLVGCGAIDRYVGIDEIVGVEVDHTERQRAILDRG